MVDRAVKNRQLDGSIVVWHFVGIGVGNRWGFPQHEDIDKDGKKIAFGVDNRWELEQGE